MNFRTTSLIFGILIAMLFIFGVVVQRNAPPDEGFLFPALHLEKKPKIKTIKMEKDGKTYTFTEDDKGNWKTQPPGSSEVWRVESVRMKEIVDQLKDAQKDEQADIPADDAAAELSPPKLTVTLEAENGKTWTLELGKKANEKWFVRSSERNKIFGVPVTSLKALDIPEWSEVRARTLLDINALDARGLTLTEQEKGKASSELAVTKTSADRWRFKQPADLDYVDFEGSKEKDKDQPGLKKVLDEIANIRIEKLSDFVDVGGKSMGDFGLTDKAATLRIDVQSGDKKEPVTGTLLVGNKVKDAKTKDSKEKDKDTYSYYVRLVKDPYNEVAKVSADKLELLFQVVQDPKMLRSRDLGFFAVDDVDAVDIKWPARSKKDTIELRKVNDVWRLFISNGKEIIGKYKGNKSAIETGSGTGKGDKAQDLSLLEWLRGRGKVLKFFDETDSKKKEAFEKAHGLDDPIAEIAVYTESLDVKKEEKKDEKKDKDGKKKSKADLEKEKAKKEVDLKEPPEFKSPKPEPVEKLYFGNKDEENNWIYVKRVAIIEDKDKKDKKTVTSYVAIPIKASTRINPTEGYLAFLDDELPTFNPENATKLVLTRGDEKFVLEKVKKTRDKDEKVKEIKESKLPEEVTKGIDKMYPKSTIKKVEEVTKDDEVIAYDLQIKTDKKALIEATFSPKGKLVREGVEEVWERKEPKELLGKDFKFVGDLGVDDLNTKEVLNRLSDLKVVKWVQRIKHADKDKDKLDEAELKKYGLKDPGLVITVTVKKELEKDKEKDSKDGESEKGDAKDKDGKDKTDKDGKDKDAKDKDGKDKDAKDKDGKDKDAKEKEADKEKGFETHTYKFSNEEGKLDKAKGYYALMDNQDIVFLANKQTVKTLKEVELRGREVLKFDADLVREIKLSGWKEKYKAFKQTLTLTRKDAKATWKAEGPEDFELDPMKATMFAAKLSRLDAEKYESFKGASDKQLKEWGLVGTKEKPIPLVITINLAKPDKDKKDKKDAKDKKEDKNKKEEMEEPITLTIGVMRKENDKDVGYYAKLSNLPDVIFIIRKSEMEVVEQGAEYFTEKGGKEIAE